MKRRQVLAAVGTAALTSVAGCATLEADLGMQTVTLGQVVLRNTGSSLFPVELEAIRNGDTIHSGSYELPPVSSPNAEPVIVYEWADDADARRWVVRARSETSEWRDATFDAARTSDCSSVLVETGGDWSEAKLLVLPQPCDAAEDN